MILTLPMKKTATGYFSRAGKSARKDKAMMTVTERAKVALQDLLHQKVDVPLACLRISLNEHGGLGLGIDVEVAGDQSVIFGGETILVIDEQLGAKLENLIMDCEETEGGKELFLVERARPNRMN